MKKILLVEDSWEIYRMVESVMSSSYQLIWKKSYQEGLSYLKDSRVDLALLDVLLPDGNGFHLCSWMQNNEKLQGTPVIFLTSRDSLDDKMLGFTLGADDYIQKPFDPQELKIRVEARLRKADQKKDMVATLKIGDIEINRNSHKVFVHDGPETRSIDLTPIEFKILVLLASEVERVFSRDEILNAVWGENVHVFGRSVDTHVSKLRKKLGDRCRNIQSVHGTGYRFRPSTDSRNIHIPNPQSYQRIDSLA